MTTAALVDWSAVWPTLLIAVLLALVLIVGAVCAITDDPSAETWIDRKDPNR